MTRPWTWGAERGHTANRPWTWGVERGHTATRPWTWGLERGQQEQQQQQAVQQQQKQQQQQQTQQQQQQQHGNPAGEGAQQGKNNKPTLRRLGKTNYLIRIPQQEGSTGETVPDGTDKIMLRTDG